MIMYGVLEGMCIHDLSSMYTFEYGAIVQMATSILVGVGVLTFLCMWLSFLLLVEPVTTY